MVRPDAHTNWIGQGAPAWTQQFGSGLNYVHADTDGNGVVDELDFGAIKANYVLPVPQGNDTTIGNQGVPLFIDFPNQNYQVGDTVVISVYLGTPQLPASSIYGIAFSIDYDNTVIDSGSVTVNYSNSWLGNYGMDLYAVDQDFFLSGQIDIGMTRVDHTTVAGYGLIADITVMIDDITGKKETEEITIGLKNISLIDMAGQPLPVKSSSAKVNISLSNEELFTRSEDRLKIYPNPSQGLTTFSVEGLIHGESSITIRDIQGREMISGSKQLRNDIYLDLSTLSPGLYLAEWKNKHQKIIKKFTIE